ncbi:GtrA family protein [Sinorhizobium sp. BG8]|uniref:GtrA family protein n=1 Tax=Sinorhizobium sp. BG8 TaxID=2613773 RepID=UPI00193D4786|nr:GtrA family protein [Sinorhizobium sp. BG8]QRM53909.1 GtrA family protein [Sinorhizobium sp. BG8]
MRKLLWFAVAGGTGFLVDAGMLAILLSLTPLGPFAARIVAIAVAMAATWMINRSLTFGRSRHSLATEGARYGSIGLSSALLNYGIYSGLLLAVPELPPLVAVALSSGLATAWSWFGYSRFVFGGAAATTE